MELFKDPWIMMDSPKLGAQERIGLFILLKAANVRIFEGTYEWFDPSYPFLAYTGSLITESISAEESIRERDRKPVLYRDIFAELTNYLKEKHDE